MSRKSIGCLIPWYGSSRAVAAPKVGEALAGLSWVGIPFTGGASEVPWITANQILLNDLHRQIINLLRVIADPRQFSEFLKRVESPSICLHPDVLDEAKSQLEDADPIIRAAAYFICSWMGRSGVSGTRQEARVNVAVRYSASGGGSAIRWFSAVAGLPTWHERLQRCEFICDTCWNMLTRIKDHPKSGVYCDPPWLVGGGLYRHTFTQEDHETLAAVLAEFRRTRVVVRHHDCEEYRKLYPRQAGWRWTKLVSHGQAHNPIVEVLIVRNGASQ